MKTPRRHKISVYLAGKVSKGIDDHTMRGWRDEYRKLLNTDGTINFLTPENEKLDENNPMHVVGHDLYLLKCSDILIVNASEKLGVGTAQEMVIAKYFGKPVLTVLPPDSHHRRSNFVMNGILIRDWIHPFVSVTSDMIFSSVEALRDFLENENLDDVISAAKDMTIIDNAISVYECTIK